MPLKLTKRLVTILQPKQMPYEVRDDQVRGFVVRILPSGAKVFWLTYAFAGKKSNRYRLGAFGNVSVEGARELAVAAAGEIAKGVNPQARKKAERAQADRSRLLKLRTFLDESFEPWFRSKWKTADVQLKRIRADFADFLDRPMTALHPVAVEGLRQRWRKAGKQAATVNRDVQRIGSVLSRAVECGVLDRHPLKGVKPLKFDKAGRVRFLSAGEEVALRDALDTRETRMRAERLRFNTWRFARGMEPLAERTGELLDNLKPMVLVALNTGMRRGELFSLRWQDVDLAAGVVTVRAATAKSGQTRRIPLNKAAATVLSRWRARHPSGDGLVFPGDEGKRLDNINKSWRGVVKIAGVTGFNFHDLRHTFASRLVQAAVDLNTVRELLGHSEIAMTQRYAHLSPDNLRAAVEKVATA